MGRAERIQHITEEHSEVIDRIRTFADGVIDPSINSLSFRYVRANAIQTFMYGLKHSPETFEFRGKSFAEFTSTFRENTSKELLTSGLKDSERWLLKHWFRGNRTYIRPRIMDRNMSLFVSAWFREGANRGEPDWDAMQEAHDSIVINKQDEEVYGAYAALYNGFQISALECFVEDTAPPDIMLRHHLLQ